MRRPILSRSLGLVIAIGLAVALATPGDARSIANTLKRTGIPPADLQAIQAAGEELYLARQARVGAETRWRNPETGTTGTARVASIRGACVDVEHTVKVVTWEAARSFVLRRCRTADGTWLLTPIASGG